jgi:hypothetical protein
MRHQEMAKHKDGGMLSVLAVQKVTIIPVVFSAEDNGDICH